MPCLILILCLTLAGCSQFFVGFVSNPGGSPLGITGTITTVAIGFVDNSQGTQVTFTAVTFANTGGATTINFCGDKRSQFPVNEVVRADYRAGIYCSPLTAVTAQG
ncbi:MAG TPA: hypothetical protein VMH03_18645 [Terriglobales bacterium]|nr:hypothetical protein [Terriglobales bacterium]